MSSMCYSKAQHYGVSEANLTHRQTRPIIGYTDPNTVFLDLGIQLEAGMKADSG
jgi:hypothetical protein